MFVLQYDALGSAVRLIIAGTYTMSILQAIQNQPEYELFRRFYAERKAPLVIVCGSGLSAPAGLPTWPRLRRDLEAAASAKAESLSQLGEQLLTPKLVTAKQEKNLWMAFKLLKEILTPNVFNALVEQKLNPTIDQEPPDSYASLLRLQPKGFVTLNLDRFAGEAIATANPGTPITPIYGKQIAQKWNLIRSAKTFLVYLHGDLNDSSTWVLTHDDLSDLINSEGHNFFLKSLYLDHIVLFVGVSADDIALSRRLLEIIGAGFDPNKLFWLTTRLDPDTTGWAADNNVSLIRYVARTNDEHQTIIQELVEDCMRYIALDNPRPNPTITNLTFDDVSATTDPAELAREHPEIVRKSLIALLQTRLDAVDNTLLYECFQQFCEDYDFAVHSSFFKAKREKFNEWFGYELQFPPLGRGNFGEVFLAESQSGELVALKIMHENILDNVEMLGGFRRGTESMKILSESGIGGMVPILQSFELPPTIVMKYVEGVSLEEAIGIRPKLPWTIKLSIAQKLGRIVSDGHSLVQTVLHRDIKPSNIMIANMDYNGAFDPDVVVLDFDMSWHKGSREKDIVFESRDDFGYLAPEQTNPTHKYTARSTRVDSYGFGMTLFFLFGAEHPRPNEALSEAWLYRVLRATEWGYDQDWVSVPKRLARIITRTTSVDQNDRLDFSSALIQLGFLEDALLRRNELDNPELWAEEMLARIPTGKLYNWDDNNGSGEIELESGITVKSLGDFKNNSVVFEIKFTHIGMYERARVSKHIVEAASYSADLFTHSGWRVIGKSAGGEAALVRAEMKVDDIRTTESDCFEVVAKVYGKFLFQ